MMHSRTLALILFAGLSACKPAQEPRQDAQKQSPDLEVSASNERADSKGTEPEKAAPPAPVKETPGYSTITLVSYECGDNCYLVYKNTAGKEERALCRAKNCGDWEKAQGLPKALIGKQVKARIGKASQFDAAGNEMSSDFPSVEEIVLP